MPAGAARIGSRKRSAKLLRVLAIEQHAAGEAHGVFRCGHFGRYNHVSGAWPVRWILAFCAVDSARPPPTRLARLASTTHIQHNSIPPP